MSSIPSRSARLCLGKITYLTTQSKKENDKKLFIAPIMCFV